MAYRYIFLGQGTYNMAYAIYEGNDDKPIGVLKLKIHNLNKDDLPDTAEKEGYEIAKSLDTTERSIRLWNEINPSQTKAKEFEMDINGVKYKGWLAPYIEGRQATDKEITATLIDIYNRTGRIIIDAVGPKNMITDESQKTVCVDIGMAVKLDNEFGPLPKIKDKDKFGKRRGSFTSVASFRDLQLMQQHYFAENSRRGVCPKSQNIIKSLIFINQHLPNVRDVSFLKEPIVAKEIAQAYDKELLDPVINSKFIDSVLTKIDWEIKELNKKKSRIFIQKHLPALLSNPSFMEYPEIMKIIADAQDKGVSGDKTVKLIKSLEFINQYQPALKDFSFLNSYPEAAEVIADAYHRNKTNPNQNIVNNTIRVINSLSIINHLSSDPRDVAYLNQPGTIQKIAKTYNQFSYDEALHLIKTAIFIHRHQLDSRNFPILEDPNISNLIADAYDIDLSGEKALHLIKSLSFIKSHLPKLKDLSFLNVLPEAAKLIAEAYDKNTEASRTDPLNLIHALSNLNLTPLNVAFLRQPGNIESIPSIYTKESKDVALQIIKSRIFMYPYLNVPGIKENPLSLKHPETKKIIATAYDNKLSSPEAENLIKSLIFINRHLTDLKDFSFLTSHPETAKKIAYAYDQELSDPNSIHKSLSRIKSRIFIHLYLPHLKDLTFLNQYPSIAKVEDIAEAYDTNNAASRKKALDLINTDKEQVQVAINPQPRYQPAGREESTQIDSKPIQIPETPDSHDIPPPRTILTSSFVTQQPSRREQPPAPPPIPTPNPPVSARKLGMRNPQQASSDDQTPLAQEQLKEYLDISRRYKDYLSRNASTNSKVNPEVLVMTIAIDRLKAHLYDDTKKNKEFVEYLKKNLLILNKRMDPQFKEFLTQLTSITKEADNKVALEEIIALARENQGSPVDAQLSHKKNTVVPPILPTMSGPERTENHVMAQPNLQPIDAQNEDKTQFDRYLEQSKEYLNYLIQKKSQTKSNSAKIENMHVAIKILTNYDKSPKEANKLFINHIQDNLSVFRKQMDQGSKKFLERLGFESVMAYGFLLLGMSAYNQAYKVTENNKVIGVFKFQIPNKFSPSNNPEIEEMYRVHASLDDPSRAVRIWNEINPDIQPKAKECEMIINGVKHKGWLAPYIEGVEASDTDKAEILTKVYEKTGRIIIDGVGDKNIITTRDGKTVCVDIGLALKLDNEFGPLPQIKDIEKLGQRRGSLVGIAAFREIRLQTHFQDTFYPSHTNREAQRKNYYSPHSVNVTKSLIFINQHLPDLRNVSFLKDYPGTAKIIADAYDKELSNPEKSATFVNTALNLIKSHSFINQHLPDLRNVSFLIDYPDTAEVIADAYDKKQSGPQSPEYFTTALDRIKAAQKAAGISPMNEQTPPTPRAPRRLPPILSTRVPAAHVQSENLGITDPQVLESHQGTRLNTVIPQISAQPPVNDHEYIKYLQHSVDYLNYLNSKPFSQLVEHKKSIMHGALGILNSQQITIQERKTGFTEHIKRNIPKLTEQMEPGFKKFLKGLGVAAAKFLGIIRIVYQPTNTKKFLDGIGLEKQRNKQSLFKNMLISFKKSMPPNDKSPPPNPRNNSSNNP